jgi:hypothetical protein
MRQPKQPFSEVNLVSAWPSNEKPTGEAPTRQGATSNTRAAQMQPEEIEPRSAAATRRVVLGRRSCRQPVLGSFSERGGVPV